MLKLIVWLRYIVVFVAVFLGFWYQASDPARSLDIAVLGLVGVVGVLSFITHVPLHKADAARLGWETKHPDWQWEVGFANLAFALAGLAVVGLGWATQAKQIVLLGYAAYLLQGGLLHAGRALLARPVELKRLLRSGGLTLVYVAFMVWLGV